MPDLNKNSQIDPDEAKDITEEENLVNEAYLEDKIDEKKIEEIETLDGLTKEAEQIKMEQGMGTSAVVSEIKPEDIQAEVPEEKEEPEEQPQVSNVSTPAEVVQEVKKETTEEIAKEIQSDAEVSSEIKMKI